MKGFEANLRRLIVKQSTGENQRFYKIVIILSLRRFAEPKKIFTGCKLDGRSGRATINKR